ncbi:peptidoglycan-binding domain-containing protein, partial [Streptomyces olivochromogenes]|uniref:peptidoglycan-binding domain-containing protein n=1 Tax=Streptomyces olivochromogenes TaxID=1963 RepID=UPI001F348B91
PAPAPAPAQTGIRQHRRFTHRRHTRAAGVFGLGAVSGLFLASSLLSNGHPTPTMPPASLGQPDQPTPGDTPLPEIPGTGLLRQGDSGHGVYELQVRLLQIPHIYDGGAISGHFDTQVRQAVARFQEQYGVRGDETGVYGDNTRYALMLRTK